MGKRKTFVFPFPVYFSGSTVSGLYSDIYKTNNQSTAKLENHLKGDMTKATDAELMDACKEFEADV